MNNYRPTERRRLPLRPNSLLPTATKGLMEMIQRTYTGYNRCFRIVKGSARVTVHRLKINVRSRQTSSPNFPRARRTEEVYIRWAVDFASRRRAIKMIRSVWKGWRMRRWCAVTPSSTMWSPHQLKNTLKQKSSKTHLPLYQNERNGWMKK